LGFVVQFRCGAGLDAAAFSGRVEHLASGRVGHFQSRTRLLEILTRMLLERQQPGNDINDLPADSPARKETYV
jgi:hypothetical protein